MRDFYYIKYNFKYLNIDNIVKIFGCKGNNYWYFCFYIFFVSIFFK